MASTKRGHSRSVEQRHEDRARVNEHGGEGRKSQCEYGARMATWKRVECRGRRANEKESGEEGDGDGRFEKGSKSRSSQVRWSGPRATLGGF